MGFLFNVDIKTAIDYDGKLNHVSLIRSLLKFLKIHKKNVINIIVFIFITILMVLSMLLFSISALCFDMFWPSDFLPEERYCNAVITVWFYNAHKCQLFQHEIQSVNEHTKSSLMTIKGLCICKIN